MFDVIPRTCINLAQFPSFPSQQVPIMSLLPINSYIAKIGINELPKDTNDFPLHETIYQHPTLIFGCTPHFKVGATDEMIRKRSI